MTPATKRECLALVFTWASLAAGAWGVMILTVWLSIKIGRML